MRILLVEPDEYYHSQLLENLEPLGEVVLRLTGTAAKQEFASFFPDIVIMELLLPDLSGFELLAHWQKLPVGRCQVVVFSKVQNLADVQAALNLGASGYFIKGQDSVAEIKKFVQSFLKV